MHEPLEDTAARARNDNGPEEDSDARQRREKADAEHELMKAALSKPAAGSIGAGDIVPFRKREKPVPQPPWPAAPAQPLRPAASTGLGDLFAKVAHQALTKRIEQDDRTYALRKRFRL